MDGEEISPAMVREDSCRKKLSRDGELYLGGIPSLQSPTVIILRIRPDLMMRGRRLMMERISGSNRKTWLSLYIVPYLELKVESCRQDHRASEYFFLGQHNMKQFRVVS
jgi:hypothetical protein